MCGRFFYVWSVCWNIERKEEGMNWRGSEKKELGVKQ